MLLRLTSVIVHWEWKKRLNMRKCLFFASSYHVYALVPPHRPSSGWTCLREWSSISFIILSLLQNWPIFREVGCVHLFSTDDSLTTVLLISLGPTYIRPNQSALRPKKLREKQIDNETKNIMKRLKNYMADIRGRPRMPQTLPLYKLYSDRLQAYLTLRYMTPLPLKDQLRARRELNIVKSIRRKLIKYKLVLRETDKSGVLHIGRAIDYERKGVEYRRSTGAYAELPSNPFKEIIYNVTHSLNRLKTSGKLKEWQRLKLVPILEKTELAYMYFVPKPHKVIIPGFFLHLRFIPHRSHCRVQKGTPPRPIMNTIHAATTKLSKYLDRLLRPLFDRFARATTIVDSVDLLSQLQKNIDQGYFNATTLFSVFDISNLFTMLPQEQTLEILAEFLREHHCETVNGHSIETIVELARIVLQVNAFVSGNKFYRQMIGGAMGSPLTLTLANIFMWKWQKEALLSKLPPKQFFGRFVSSETHPPSFVFYLLLSIVDMLTT